VRVKRTEPLCHASPCVWLESRRSGAEPIRSRGCLDGERRERSRSRGNIPSRCGLAMRDGAAPLPFSSSVSLPSRCCLSLSCLLLPLRWRDAGAREELAVATRTRSSHPRRRLPRGETHGGRGRAEAGHRPRAELAQVGGAELAQVGGAELATSSPIKNEQSSPRPVAGFAQGSGAGCAPLLPDPGRPRGSPRPAARGSPRPTTRGLPRPAAPATGSCCSRSSVG
jgi:hypothetical protein